MNLDHAFIHAGAAYDRQRMKHANLGYIDAPNINFKQEFNKREQE
jgi:hypothetical protein